MIHSKRKLVNKSNILYREERESDIVTCSGSLISLQKRMWNIVDEHLVKITKDIERLKEVNETKRDYNSYLEYFDWGGYEDNPQEEYDFLESKLRETIESYHEQINLLIKTSQELTIHLNSIKSQNL